MAFTFFATPDDIEKKFKKIKKFRHSLYSFYSMMPKGGDLHHHYSGSLYTEAYVDYIIDNNYYININNFSVIEDLSAVMDKDNYKKIKDYFTGKELISFRSRLIREWSVKDFINGLGNDEHFFNCFEKFGLASKKYNKKDGLIELKNRAINQKLSYLESMFVTCNTKSVLSKIEIINNLDKELEDFNTVINLDKNPISDENYNKLNILIENFILLNTDFFTELKKCATNHNEEIEFFFIDDNFNNSEFTLRFQNYVVRNNFPSQVFINLAASFHSSSTSKFVYGVNIVSAENGIKSMKYYNLHMLFYRYFENKYKDVKYCVHAGELVSGMVKPENLGVNIKKALTLKNLRRIGHAVDIIYDNEFSKTIKILQDRNEINKELINDYNKNFDVNFLSKCIDEDKNYLAIEINLSSNEFILKVKDDLHPVELYYRNGIPIIVCTDDEGILRTSITEQFAILTYKYGFDYLDIKKICFDSIRYAHLEKSKKIELFEKLLIDFQEFENSIDDFISIYADNEADNDFIENITNFNKNDEYNELVKSNTYSKFKGISNFSN